MNEYKILDKYTIVYTDNELITEVLRNGEQWRNVIGDNLIHGLFWRVLELEQQLKEIKDGATPTPNNPH